MLISIRMLIFHEPVTAALNQAVQQASRVRMMTRRRTRTNTRKNLRRCIHTENKAAFCDGKRILDLKNTSMSNLVISTRFSSSSSFGRHVLIPFAHSACSHFSTPSIRLTFYMYIVLLYEILLTLHSCIRANESRAKKKKGWTGHNSFDCNSIYLVCLPACLSVHFLSVAWITSLKAAEYSRRPIDCAS